MTELLMDVFCRCSLMPKSHRYLLNCWCFSYDELDIVSRISFAKLICMKDQQLYRAYY